MKKRPPLHPQRQKKFRRWRSRYDIIWRRPTRPNRGPSRPAGDWPAAAAIRAMRARVSSTILRPPRSRAIRRPRRSRSRARSRPKSRLL